MNITLRLLGLPVARIEVDATPCSSYTHVDIPWS